MTNVFYRAPKKKLMIVDRGEGIYLYDDQGNKYIDGASGAVGSNIGHGNQEVVKAMTEQAQKVAFSHLSRWIPQSLEQLADLVAEISPGTLNKLYPVSGGSEATEAAIKMARQYFIECDGTSSKYRVVSRWKSFHGNTIGALSMTGDKRRKNYTPMLLNFPHIAPAYCYRCPFDKKTGNLWC